MNAKTSLTLTILLGILIPLYGFADQNITELSYIKMLKAIEEDSTQEISTLIDNGFEVGTIVDGKPILLAHAIRKNSRRSIDLLIENGASISAIVDEDTKETLIHYAVKKNRPFAVERLLEHGAEVNAINARKFTPLIFAASRNIALVKLLINGGADVNAISDSGISPLIAALESNEGRERAELLEEYGAEFNVQNYVETSCDKCHSQDRLKEFENTAPILDGQNSLYTASQLDNFRTGERVLGTMNTLASRLTDSSIMDIAEYYETSTLKWSTETDSRERIDRGRKLYFEKIVNNGLPACAACHGRTGHGIEKAGIPRLAGQHVAYTIDQLDLFARGKRVSFGGQVMEKIAVTLSKEEMKDLANYVRVMDE